MKKGHRPLLLCLGYHSRVEIPHTLRLSPFLRKSKGLLHGLKGITNNSFKRLVGLLNGLEGSSVVDVGANIGQFGLDLRSHGFGGHIFSFEPVAESFEILGSTSRKNKPWSAYRLGLGSRSCKLNINVSGNAGLSSSFLDMNTIHLEHFPKSNTVKVEEVQISTLDIQVKQLNLNPRLLVLKIDVQGFEFEVLQGARNALHYIPYCFLEISLIPMYKVEASLLDLLSYLSTCDHEVIDVFRGTMAGNGDLLQIDVLTKNRNS